MSVFEITIQRKDEGAWPVVVRHQPAAQALAQWSRGRLDLSPNALVGVPPPDKAYGLLLGQVLFRDDIRDAFARAMTGAEGRDERLRVLLIVEADDLRDLHWEQLCAPLDRGWDYLLLNQQTPFSLYLPSQIERRFPPIGRRDLRALVLVAGPEELKGDYGLARFDVAATVGSIQHALGEIPSDALASVQLAIGPPTLNALCEHLTTGHHTLLHIVCHGRVEAESGETVLYFPGDESGRPVRATTLIERLCRLRRLPHLTFLSTCESADPRAEAGLGGLGQRLVRELGTPAVVAMTDRISVDTAEALASAFFARLRESGEVDCALSAALVGLQGRYDVTVPALFGRLGGRQLFSDALDRPLTETEIGYGLEQMRALIEQRAPVLLPEVERQTATVQSTLGADPAALSTEAHREREAALAAANQLCCQALDLSFNALALGQAPPAYDGRCPFPGLLAFGARYAASGQKEQDDRAFFFGREALVDKLMGRLRAHGFLAVLGPSGCGKSSLVLAGLVPTLQARWPRLRAAYLQPGSEPLAQLEAALSDASGGDGRPNLIIVDQFEELFTLCRDEGKRQVFVDRLLALSARTALVLTLRADFWGECAAYQALKDEMQAHQELVGPMDAAALRGAMERQADHVGLRFEAGLGEAILDDVEGEPGAMPLLQHALLLLWQRRHGRWLRWEEYRAIGGIQQAIAHTADEVYLGLAGQEQARMRDIFLRLTRLEDAPAGAEARDTRRRVGLAELVPAGSDPAGTIALVKRLADARLVVTSLNAASGQEEVEVAHEALIRHWPRLRDWLEEDRAELHLREGVREAALEWEASDRDEAYLVHRGGRLEDVEALRRQPRFALNELELAYVEACAGLREREARQKEDQRQRELKLAQERATEAEARQQAEEEARHQADQRAEEQARAAASLRKRALMLAGVMVLALIAAAAAALLGVDANRNRKEAEEAQAAAVAEKDRAESRALAAQSDRQFDLARNDLSLLLAIESLRVDETEAGRTALHQAMTAPVDALQIFAHDDFVQYATWNGDESRVLTASDDGTARVWDAATGAELLSLSHESGVLLARWNGDESRILTVDWDGEAHVWDAASEQEAFSLFHDGGITEARWNGDGSRILTVDLNGEAQVWDAASRQELFSLPHNGWITEARWNGDGSRILTAGCDQVDTEGYCTAYAALVWDAASGEELLPPLVHDYEVNQAIWAAGESTIVTASGDVVHFWDAETGEELAQLPHVSAVTHVAWNEDEDLLMSSTEEGTVFVWDLEAVQAEWELYSQGAGGEEGEIFTWDPETSPPRFTLRHDAWVNEAAWSGDGQFILTASDDSTARIWDADTGNRLLTLGHGDWVRHATWSADGNRVLTASYDGTARIWEMTKGVELLTLPSGQEARWNQDGSRIVTVGLDGLAQSWNATNGTELFSFPRGAEAFEGVAGWSTDGNRVVTIACDRVESDCLWHTVTVWDANTGDKLATLTHQARVVQWDWDGSGQRILTVAGDNTVRVWDAVTGAELLILPDQGRVSQATWSPDSSRLLTTGCEATDPDGECQSGVLRVWDVGSRQVLLPLNPQDWLDSAYWSPDGLLILTLTVSDTYKAAYGWDAATGEERFAIETGSDSEFGGFSSDGSRLIIGDSVYDTASGEELVQIKHSGGAPLAKSLNKDGSLVLSSGWDGRARMWDTASGDQIRSLSHELAVNDAVWNSDDSLILTSSEDRTARVWDAATGELLLILPNDRPVERAAWSPDERTILTVNKDGAVTLYYADVGDLLAAACERVRRNMTEEQWKQFMGDEPYRPTCPEVETRAARVAPVPSAQPSTDVMANQPAATPLPAPTAVPTEASEGPSPSLELQPFEDEAGVFSISYPSSLDPIDTAPEEYGYDYGTILSAADESAGIGVFFRPLDGPLTDAGWEEFAAANTGIADLDAQFDLGPNAVELNRWTRDPGEHLVYFEFESGERHGLSRIEEAGGVLAVALWATTVDRWPEMREAMVESITSFDWSPEAAAAQLAEGSSPSVELLPFEDEAGVFSISYPTSLDQIDTEASMGYGYTTTLQAADESAAIGVFFRPLDGPLTDADWEEFAAANTGIADLDAQFDLGPGVVELIRWSGDPGQHYVRSEFESEVYHGLSCIEEAGGVLAVALWVTTVDRWPEMREAMVESWASFGWSPEAAAAQLAP